MNTLWFQLHYMTVLLFGRLNQELNAKRFIKRSIRRVDWSDRKNKCMTITVSVRQTRVQGKYCKKNTTQRITLKKLQKNTFKNKYLKENCVQR